MGSYLMPKKAPTDDKEVQTIIRVYPYILEDNLVANMVSDRKCQTLVSINPKQNNKTFYSMLQFIPYQDIQDSYLRIIDLPRQTRLKFDSNSEIKWHLNNNLNNLYLDDDALSELYLDLKKRIDDRSVTKRKTFMEGSTQTELQVHPHLLQNDQIATVCDNTATQTFDNELKSIVSDDDGNLDHIISTLNSLID